MTDEDMNQELAVEYSDHLEHDKENNKVTNVFQEEDELEYAEPLDGEAKDLLYDHCENLVSKTLVKAFKLPTEPHHSLYQIGWIKKGPTLKVIEICNIPLAIRKHYNELVICDVIDIKAFRTLATLVASPKEFQAERKETRVSYALVVKGIKYVMDNAIPVVIKPLLAEFGKITKDYTLDALPPLRNIQNQIDLYANDKDYGNILMDLITKQHRDFDVRSRPEEQHLVVPCSHEDIVKEEADIIGPIMLVEDEPLMMLGSGPNIIKEDFSSDLDGQHSTNESKPYHNTLRWQICMNVWLKQEMVCAQRRWDPGITWLKILKEQLEDKVFFELDIYEFHSKDMNEGKHSRLSSNERGNDEDMIQESAEEYIDHLEHDKSKGTGKN
uniref:Putative nucleotidyltransferase, ribonuclease H n=1 Tax=Tanacetum cinerariifolium TaxID=118510 RepID=A0A6L2NSJ4_TANCI|nr:putative nucleotidyltransferase, ribonuclease H [Tanacetum cinerariifolium]